jgi:hypothetical protein
MGMKLFVLLAGLVGTQVLTAQQVLTDSDIARMVGAGIAQDIILKMIAESPVEFRLQPERIIALKKAGVPDDMVRAMMTHDRQAPSVRYIHFSSEVRTASAKKKGLGRLKIW